MITRSEPVSKHSVSVGLVCYTMATEDDCESAPWQKSNVCQEMQMMIVAEATGQLLLYKVKQGNGGQGRGGGKCSRKGKGWR